MRWLAHAAQACRSPVAVIALIALASCATPTDDRSPLRSVAEVWRLSSDALQRGRPVELQATVTLADSRLHLLVVQDDTGGLPVAMVAGPSDLTTGETVRVRAFTGSEAFAPVLVKAVIERIGAGKLPPTPLAEPERLLRGELDYRLVDVRCLFTGEFSEVTRFERAAEVGGRRIGIVGNVGDLVVWSSHSPVPADVRGVPISTRSPSGEVLAVFLFVGSASDVRLREPIASAPTGSVGQPSRNAGALAAERPLDSVVAVKSLANEDAARGYPVRLRGVVTGFEGGSFFLQDERAALFVFPGAGPPPLAVGDLVEVQGRTDSGGYAPVVVASGVQRLGPGRLPTPIRPNIDEPMSGIEENAWAEVDGTVRSVRFVAGGRANLSLQSGAAQALVDLMAVRSPERLSRLVNARVTVRGIYAPLFTIDRQFAGVRLLLADEDAIRTSPQPADDTFESPARTIRSLRAFHPEGFPRHRVKIAGVATFVALDGSAYLSDGTGAIRLEGHGSSPLRVGGAVEAVGSLVTTHPSAVLDAVETRPAGPRPPPEPRSVSAEDLMTGIFDGRLVRIDAYLRERELVRGDRIFRVESGRQSFEAVIEHPEPLPGWEDLREGALLRFTGVCRLTWTSDELPPAPASVRVLLRSPEDVVVLQRAPWWTVRRAAVAALWLLGSLLGAAAWVATLRHRVAAQTALLARQMAHREALETQLREAQKLESLGRLAGGVAHDFNNLLVVIVGYCDLLLRELRGQERASGRLVQIQKAAQKASALTRQLLAFSRRQILNPAVLDLRTVVQDMEQMLRRLVGEDVRLRIALPAVPAPALVDAGQMGQVLMNLAANARDAMPDGGQLSIEVETVHLDESYAAVHAGVSAGDYVRLTVSDTGTGMDAATQAHLFEPFFTTKAAGRGTGLGLSSAFGIVKQSGGHVWAYSEPGHGSSFKIHLPLAAGEPSSAAAAPATAAATGGNETILVVEDHAEVRELVVAALEARGYRILAAGDAEQASILAREHASPVHLLITDVVLPGQNGRVLAERLSAEQPGLRVLFTSGYTQDVIAQRGILEAGIDYLAKPFSPDDLARRVRAALDR